MIRLIHSLTVWCLSFLDRLVRVQYARFIDCSPALYVREVCLAFAHVPSICFLSVCLRLASTDYLCVCPSYLLLVCLSVA